MRPLSGLIHSLAMFLLLTGTANSDILPPCPENLREAHVPAGFLPVWESDRPSVGLALSGGGARGFAHIGVLQVFEEEAVPIDHITGTSIGAIIGAYHAAGYTADEIEHLVLTTDWNSFFSDSPRRRNLFLAQKEIANQELITVRFRQGRPYVPSAFVVGQTLYLTLLEQLHRAPYFHANGGYGAMKTPLGIVATDLEAGERVFLRSGDLTMTLRGAMAVPVIFQPMEWEGRYIVDGGAVENIPVRAAKEMGDGTVIAVDCVTPSEPAARPEELWDVANQVTTMMTVSNDSISRSLADVLIQPDLVAVGNAEFQHAKELIAAGRAAARDALPEIRRRLHFPGERIGIPFELRDVELNGVPEGKVQEALQAMQPPTGSTNTLAVNASLERLLRHLKQAGYGAAKVRTMLTEQGRLLVRVDPGIVRDIVVEGVEQAEHAMVQRDVRIRVGDPLKTPRLVKSLTQLHATGRYKAAFGYLEPHPDGGVIVHVRVEPAAYPKLGLGLGFDSDRKARYFADFSLQPNLVRTGEQISFRAKYGVRDRDYSLRFRTDRIGSTYIGLAGRTEFVSRERDLFTSDSEVREVWTYRFYRTHAALQFNLRTWGILSAGVLGEQAQTERPSGEETRYHTATDFSFGIDTEDRKPFAQQGIRIRFRYTAYLNWLTVEEPFNRLSMENEFVTPLLPRLYGRLGIKGGVAERTTPGMHRFRIGGMEDFPAFKPDRFIALRYAQNTVELRYDMISRFIADAYLLVRYDMIAYSDNENWRPRYRDFVHSYAAGFALDTVLGPMELWYAVAPETDGTPYSQRVMINLGYQF
ncbi:BamA/TamA family outer membrane protein [bacterium]|nr:BamA/TamA family outer membrane protein [bacterium]